MIDLNNKILLRNGQIITDASSIIYMDKINILKLYADIKNILIPRPIFNELNGLIITKDYHKLIKIKDLVKSSNKINIDYKGLKYPDKTLIDSFYMHLSDGILTDDGMVCQYCKNNAIPFINTPMALFSLKLCNIIRLNDFFQKLDEIYRIGRYKKFVKKYMDEVINMHLRNV